MRIITISREFGSGGRELGKRLADALGIPCYDKEIIAEVAKLHGVTTERVEHISNADIRQVYAATVGRSLLSPMYHNTGAISFHASQQEVIKKLASRGDCVIVGQNADIVLEKEKPLNLFIYASEEAKIKRCIAHIREGETEKSIRAQMKRIDKTRASNRRLMTDKAWGNPQSYHLCVNTTGTEIKELVPALAEYAKAWFQNQ